MNCQHHPEVNAVAVCAGCAEPYCANCLIELGGQQYCGACKMLAIKGKKISIKDSMMVEHPDAGQALAMACVSFLCVGFILGPMAMVKAAKARAEIDNSPRLRGWGKTIAATIIGLSGTLASIVGLVARLPIR